MAEARKLPLISLAEVRASSEADGHPILLAFDEGWGPGATHWKAGTPGEQVITVAMREPSALGQVTLQIEEREVMRTQEVQLALSTDGGVTYRELVRQEFTFSPAGATWEDERRFDRITSRMCDSSSSRRRGGATFTRRSLPSVCGHRRDKDAPRRRS